MAGGSCWFPLNDKKGPWAQDAHSLKSLQPNSVWPPQIESGFLSKQCEIDRGFAKLGDRKKKDRSPLEEHASTMQSPPKLFSVILQVACV